jgi:hypothetical protein
MSEDTGLAKRGLLLLGAMTAIVTVVLVILFNRTGAEAPVAPDGGDPSAVGWVIRYNAAAALARRGSDNVPWPLYRELLDEKQQMRNFRVELDDGQVAVDEVAARTALISALRALGDWHAKQRAANTTAAPPELRPIYEQVDRLAESPVAELKKEAERARGTFFRG